MQDLGFTSQYDVVTGTLELGGVIDHDALPRIHEEVDRAFRRTACFLTVDLSRAHRVPARTLGRLVQLCNAHYPGTLVRMPVRPQSAGDVVVPAPRRAQLRAIA